MEEMETFEHTRRKPYSIAIGIRPKTREIVFARVVSMYIKALNVPKEAKIAWNRGKDGERTRLWENTLESVKPVLKEGSKVASDGCGVLQNVVTKVLPKSKHIAHYNYDKMWRINQVCAKLRHHISRLRRRTWATTKDWRQLQKHLDLFIAYQNGYKVG